MTPQYKSPLHYRPKNYALFVLILTCHFAFAQDTTRFIKLPQSVFLDIITTTARFEINHATEFKHVDLPKKYHNTFLGYVKDSSATTDTGLKSVVYYTFSLANGKTINGDIYWNDTKSYIVFKIDNNTYVNYFTREGVTQIKTLFKL